MIKNDGHVKAAQKAVKNLQQVLEGVMNTAKIAISLDPKLLERLDQLVRNQVFPKALHNNNLPELMSMRQDWCGYMVSHPVI